MLKRLFLSLILLAGIFAGFCIYLQLNTNNYHVVHYSYFSQKEFYEDAYKYVKIPQVKTQAVIVNHHLLASSYIAEEFNILATTAQVTVLLVSPNHFSSGKFEIATSRADWQTPYGVLEPDVRLINILTKTNLLGVDEDPFLQEHGVSGLVGFIKKSLPNARIVPIIFKDRISLSRALDFANETYKVMPNNLVVIGSFDFSHYLPKNASIFHDFTSLNVLNNFDFQEIYKLDIDSKPGLSYYLSLVKKMGMSNFNLLEHSNSAELTKKDLLESTSYINGYYNSELTAKEQVITLLSLGVMEVNSQTYSKFSLEYLERFFSGQNKTVVLFDGNNKNIQFQFENKGVNIKLDKIFETKLNESNIKILDCENKQSPIINQDFFKIDICQNSNINKVVQNKNTLTFYSKGKFLNKESEFIAFGLVSSKNSLKLFLFPIALRDGQFKLLVGWESDKILADMASNSAVNTELKSQIKSGVVEINN